MLRDITIGQYVDGNSVIHRMDARVKIILSMVYIALLFVVHSLAAYAFISVFTVSLIFISKVPVKYVLRGLKPMLYILIFTAVMNIFMVGAGVL